MNHLELASAAKSLWRRSIRTRRGRLILLALWMSLSVGLGARYGVVSSPKYLAQAQIVAYLENHFLIISETRDEVVLQLDAAGLRYRYIYARKSGVLRKDLIAPEEAILRSSSFTWNDEDLKAASELVKDILAPTISTFVGESLITRSMKAADNALKAAEPISRPLRAREEAALYAVAAVVGVSGGYLGYGLTYDDAKNFDNDTVRKVLEDESIWRSLAKWVLAAASVQATRDNIAVIEEVAPEAMFSTIYLRHAPIKLYELRAKCDTFLAAMEKVRARGREASG
jgi:hypothetical protein